MRTKMCAVFAASLLVLTACSSGDGDKSTETSPGAEDSGEMVEVTMGVLPIVPSVALSLGVTEGIFAEHGFDVTLDSAGGGAALLPAVVSGDMEFAVSNPLSVMLAQEQGLDIDIISGYSHSIAEGPDVNGVWAMPDSGIESPKDLAGKTVAVNNLKTIGEVTIREVVERDGGDPDAIKFVELGFPDQPAALASGNIDAAWVPEPFQTIIEKQGAELVTYSYQATTPGLGTMIVLTSGKLADSDPDMVKRFTAAVDEVATFAQDNPDKIRQELTTFLDMDDELAGEVLVEEFRPAIDRDSMQQLADLSLEQGVLSEPVDMERLLP